MTEPKQKPTPQGQVVIDLMAALKESLRQKAEREQQLAQSKRPILPKPKPRPRRLHPIVRGY